jgi:hypothetical protein
LFQNKKEYDEIYNGVETAKKRQIELEERLRETDIQLREAKVHTNIKILF